MLIFNDTDTVFDTDTAVALGAFDGVHLGHRAVISEAVRLAKEDGLLPAVFTFRDLPKSALLPESARTIPLSDFEERSGLIAALGVEALVAPDFASVRDMEAEDFAKTVLFGSLRARRVVCGEDYRFGARGAGDAALLKELCEKNGAALTVVPPVMHNGKKISSTLIRSLLKEGRTAEAEMLLGRQLNI